jgi:hypothetical protein
MKIKFSLALLIVSAACIVLWQANGPTDYQPSTVAIAKPNPARATITAEVVAPQPTQARPITSSAVRSATEVGSQCASLLATPSTARRQLEFAKLLSETRDEAGIRAILAVFRERYHAGKRDSAEWRLIWSELVERDPKAAAALVDSYVDDPKWQAGGLAAVAHDWAVKDPQSAIAWLASHQGLTDNALDNATFSMMAGYAENDLIAATAYAMSVFGPGDNLWGDTSWVLTSTALQSGGVKGLTSYYESLPEASQRRLFIATSNRLGVVGLQTKVEWLTAQAASLLRHDTPYREAAQAYAEEDPAAALKWVFSLPASPTEGKVVGVGYASFPWMAKDYDKFFRHYQTLIPDQQRQILTAVQEASQNPKLTEAKRAAAVKFLTDLGAGR